MRRYLGLLCPLDELIPLLWRVVLSCLIAFLIIFYCVLDILNFILLLNFILGCYSVTWKQWRSWFLSCFRCTQGVLNLGLNLYHCWGKTLLIIPPYAPGFSLWLVQTGPEIDCFNLFLWLFLLPWLVSSHIPLSGIPKRDSRSLCPLSLHPGTLSQL